MHSVYKPPAEKRPIGRTNVWSGNIKKKNSEHSRTSARNTLRSPSLHAIPVLNLSGTSYKLGWYFSTLFLFE